MAIEHGFKTTPDGKRNMGNLREFHYVGEDKERRLSEIMEEKKIGKEEAEKILWAEEVAITLKQNAS